MPRPNPMIVPEGRKKVRVVVKKKGFTERQRAFIREFVTNGNNGTKAAIAAGYSEKSARKIASENWTKPDIVQEKDRLMSKIADECGCTKELVFNKLKEATTLDMDSKGSIVLKALELIGKHHGLFTDKSEISVKSHEDWLDDMKDE